MAPEGIKLPSDSTVASEKLHRSASPQTNVEAQVPQAKQSPTPNPLATVVLQSKAIIEGRKNELFQLLLQNDPKNAPPIKIYADTNISPGTALLLELDEKGQYQPIETPNKAQLSKLITLELEFWQAHLYPKAAASSTPSLPTPEALLALAKQHPQLKPLVEWLTQRPSQLTGHTVKQWVQEHSPLALMRTFLGSPQNQGFSAPISQLVTQPISTNAQTTTPAIPNQPSNNLTAKPLTNAQAVNVDIPADTKPAGSINTPTTQAPAIIPVKAFLKFAFNISLNQPSTSTTTNSAASSTSATTPITPNTSSAATTQTSTHEQLAPAIIRSKQLAPIIGQLPAVKTSAVANFINEQSQRLNITMANNAVAEKLAPTMPTTSVASAVTGEAAKQGIVNSNTPTAPSSTQTPNTVVPSTVATGTEQIKSNAINSALTSSGSEFKPLVSPIKADNPEPNTLKQMTNELLQRTNIKPAEQAVRSDAPTADNLIEVKLGQWLTLLEQTQMKNAPELSNLLKAKAMAMLNNTAEQGDKVQGDAKNPAQANTAEKETSLNQLRSWMEATQAKVLHQAVQAASTQWQTPDLPVIQQMQLPLIWLGLTSWADLEWWQEKNKKQSSDEDDADSKRRWRMRIYLNISPLSEFCADIDWHPTDTHLVFWSEDTATLAHLNTLVPTLKEWTQGLSDESVIQTRHGMPKRASDQQLKRTNHHLVDVKT